MFTKKNLVWVTTLGVLGSISNTSHSQDLRGLLGKLQQLQQQSQSSNSEQSQNQQPIQQKSATPAVGSDSAHDSQPKGRPTATRPAITRTPASKAILPEWEELDFAHSPSIYLPSSLGGFPNSREIEVRYYLKTSDGQPYQFGATHEVNCQTKELRATELSPVHLSHDQYPRVFYDRPEFRPSREWVTPTAFPIYSEVISRACAENSIPKGEAYWDFTPAQQSKTIAEKFDIRGIKLGMSLQEVLNLKSIVDHKKSGKSCEASDPRTPQISTGPEPFAFDSYLDCGFFSYFDGSVRLIVGFIGGKSHYIGVNGIKPNREDFAKSDDYIPPLVRTLTTDRMNAEPQVTERRFAGSDITISRGVRQITYTWTNAQDEKFRVFPSKVFKNIRERLPFNFPDLRVTLISPEYVALRDQMISKSIQQQDDRQKASKEKAKSNI